MKERGLSIQEAMDFIGEWYQSKAEEFCNVMRELPPCGTIDTRNQIKMYVTAIANWVTGNFEWSLRTRRYFTVDQDPVKDGWAVTLRRKTTHDRRMTEDGPDADAVV